MFKRSLTIWFFFIYAAIRVFSYFFGPATPLQTQHPTNTLVTIALIALTSYLLVKRDVRGWYIIGLEIILGGSGGYLQALGLSLRTWLLFVSMTTYFYNLMYFNQISTWAKKEKRAILAFGILLIAAGIGSVTGYKNYHNTRLIFSDALPYFFLLYYFPLRNLWSDVKFKTIIQNALFSAILANFVFVAVTFIGFSSNLFILQDSYYHWFRDVANGKITELGHFYRLVVNEHLLLVPLMLYFSNQIIKKQQAYLNAILLTLCTLVLTTNLTRIYIVALAFGFFFLFTFALWKRWLATGITIAILFIIGFSSMHFAASRGESMGWELFGIRLGSIVAPSSEESSLSRLLILPLALEKIKTKPFLGYGLGDTVTVYSPVLKKEITTPHFDWGYLEILAELGIAGFIAWLTVLQLVYKRITGAPWLTWQIASLVSLLIINITSPALFHVFGILWILILLNSEVIENKKAAL